MSVEYTVSGYLYIYALVFEIFFLSPQSGRPTNTLSAYFAFPVNDTGYARVRLDMRKIEGDVFT
jgi:hypothetical protein